MIASFLVISEIFASFLFTNEIFAKLLSKSETFAYFLFIRKMFASFVSISEMIISLHVVCVCFFQVPWDGLLSAVVAFYKHVCLFLLFFLTVCGKKTSEYNQEIPHAWTNPRNPLEDKTIHTVTIQLK